MPISNKILSEITKLDVEEPLKSAMMEILQLEDNGVKQWKAQYQAIINEYNAHIVDGDK